MATSAFSARRERVWGGGCAVVTFGMTVCADGKIKYETITDTVHVVAESTTLRRIMTQRAESIMYRRRGYDGRHARVTPAPDVLQECICNLYHSAVQVEIARLTPLILRWLYCSAVRDHLQSFSLPYWSGKWRS